MSALSDDAFNDCPEGEPPVGKPAWAKDKVNTRTIRSSTDYKKFWAACREKAATTRNPDGSFGQVCAMDGEPIDYSLRYPHPMSWSLDHKKSVRDHPELLLDPNNWQSSHWICNTIRQTDDMPAELGDVSDW